MATKETEPVRRETTPPTLDELNTGKGKAANTMTANEYHRYFHPVATWLTYSVTGA